MAQVRQLHGARELEHLLAKRLNETRTPKLLGPSVTLLALATDRNWRQR